MNFEDLQGIINREGIIFLSFGGILTQTLISELTESLEKEAAMHNLDMNTTHDISVVFIEITQNIMNYATSKQKDSKNYNSEGMIIVGRNTDNNYYVCSQNVITTKDREKIEPRLKHIKPLSKDELKVSYRELRRSGKHTHGRGGGIGFYEIAKRSKYINFNFIEVNEDKNYFQFESIIEREKKN